MRLPLDYLELLLIAGAALFLIFILFFLRRREITRVSPLEEALEKVVEEDQGQLELFLPLLVLEERYPVFGQIVALVVDRCGVGSLLQRPDFVEPAQYLSQAAFSDQERAYLRGALCHMVRSLLDDPDVEYGCRPELSGLVDQFIEEVSREKGEPLVSTSAAFRK